MKRILCAAIAACAMTTAQETAAQEGASALRQQQEALFQQLFEEPDNLDLMFQHALISIELSDFEAAISTLERMLIYNPDLARAKVELGAAYFRLGAYENARFYFEDVLEEESLPPEVQTRVNGFLAEISRRTAESGFVGVAMVGLTFSSNANLGPSDTDILLFGLPATLQDQFVKSDDFGVRTAVYGSHFYDLGQPDGDAWRTDASIFSTHYFDETQGDIDSFAIRTGPRLSLDTRSYGPKLRPFVEADALRAANATLYTTLGAGVEYSDTVDDRTNVFADFRAAWREYYNGRDAFDGATARANAGFSYEVQKNTSLQLAAYAETDLARDDANTNLELGVRLRGSYSYDTGFAFTDRLWTLSGYVQGAFRQFDDPNIAIDPSRSRADKDFRLGVSNVFHLTGGWFAQAEADLLVRDSNLPNFDITNIGVTMSVGRSF